MENVEGRSVTTPPTNRPKSRFSWLKTVTSVPSVIGALFKPDIDHPIIIPPSTLEKTKLVTRTPASSRQPI